MCDGRCVTAPGRRVCRTGQSRQCRLSTPHRTPDLFHLVQRCRGADLAVSGTLAYSRASATVHRSASAFVRPSNQSRTASASSGKVAVATAKTLAAYGALPFLVIGKCFRSHTFARKKGTLRHCLGQSLRVLSRPGALHPLFARSLVVKVGAEFSPQGRKTAGGRTARSLAEPGVRHRPRCACTRDRDVSNGGETAPHRVRLHAAPAALGRGS